MAFKEDVIKIDIAVYSEIKTTMFWARKRFAQTFTKKDWIDYVHVDFKKINEIEYSVFYEHNEVLKALDDTAMKILSE